MTRNDEAATVRDAREALDDAVAHLVDARVALDNLRALNGCDHYHDAMRAVTFAAQALGVSTMDLVAMAAGRSTGTAA